MKRLYCILERIGGVLSGALMSLAVVSVVVLGFALLAPVMGHLFAIPIVVLCIRLVEAPLSRTCSL